MLSTKQIIFGITGIALTIIGFLFSDEEKYPVAVKFSGPMIVIGVLLVGLSIPVKYNWIAKGTY